MKPSAGEARELGGSTQLVVGGKKLKWVLPFALILPCLLLGGWSFSQQVDRQSELVAKGRELFFNETFDGNGRTCMTCHRPEDNYRITPEFIATLPDDDPLFVAEYNPDLKEHFEKPDLMRKYGLILGNQDGDDDLENKYVMRTVQTLRSVRTSINGSAFEGFENKLSYLPPLTGWAGDGSPDGTLRGFTNGAIKAHMTKTLNRVPGVDFRYATDEELDALEAYILTLGRQEELSLPLPLKGEVARLGQELFIDKDQKNARCNTCHINASGSAMSADARTQGRWVNLGSLHLNTGEENLTNPLLQMLPIDDGFGVVGVTTYRGETLRTGLFRMNTPPVVEAADAGPLFHAGFLNSVEEVVAFYNEDAFNNSISGRNMARDFGGPTNLSATEVLALGAFLRVINALDNIRESTELLEESLEQGWLEREDRKRLLREANYETEDAIIVLAGVNLHPIAVARLRMAQELTEQALDSALSRNRLTQQAIEAHKKARRELVESPEETQAGGKG